MANNRKKAPAKSKHPLSGWKANDLGLTGWPEKDKPKKIKRGGKMKEGMTAYIRDLVLMWRSANMKFNTDYHIDHGHSYELANVSARNMQFFDCSIIFDYVFDNLDEMYPDTDVPPSTDAVLPADNVGLYINSDSIEYEIFFYCIPVLGGKDPNDEIYYRRHTMFIVSLTLIEPNLLSLQI